MKRASLLAAGALALATAAFGQEAATLYVSGNSIKVADAAGGTVLSISPMFWGPNWGWTGVNGQFVRQEGGSEARIHGAFGNTDGVTFEGTIRLSAPDRRHVSVQGNFSVSADTDLTVASLAMSFGGAFHGAGRLTVVNGAGGQTVAGMPPSGGGPGAVPDAKEIRVRNAAGEAITVAYDTALDIPVDGGAFRWPLAAGRMLAAEPREWSFDIEFPFDVDAYFVAEDIPMPADIDRYFAWTAASDTGPSVIGMEALLDAPAGRHGRVTREGDRLVYNGAPAKFWGLNTCYAGIAPSKETAERRAAFYAKYGVNAVRLHKFADGPGWDGVLSPQSAVAYSDAPDKAPAMDYYIACLKEKGIYVTLSANFGNVKVGPDDRGRIPFLAEMGNPNDQGWQGVNHAGLWLSPEIQDMQIEQLCNLLLRVNTATGLTYAEDPCILAVELVNENCAFFYNIWGGANGVPTLKRMAGERFRDWLHAKYGTEEALLAAWGDVNYHGVPDQGTDGESWEGAIYPAGNPWYWDNVTDGRWPRLLDAALFWRDCQADFYGRFVAAIRETGYEGEILSSNWLAGSGVAHYLNLLSDREVGLIDRHNYHGDTWAMFHRPGGGIISVGANTQMEDRPYMVSEWIHEAKPFFADPAIPKPFDIASEGPVLFSAYGMGLNGWDASFLFENADDGRFKAQIADTWDVVLPNIIGLFPAISRMVLRGDLRESDLVFARNIDLESLESGKLGFADTTTQTAYDVRDFTSNILPESLMAVGRMVVRLNDEPAATERVDPARFMEGGMYRSATGELAWRPGESPRDGHITINAPRTQALAGFAKGRKAELADVDIATDNPYAILYVTSLDGDKPIAEAESLLVTALARIRNTDHRVIAGSSLDWGRGPILMEPVKAEITLKRPGAFTVHALDQDGRRTGVTLPADGQTIALDTAQEKTIYYEIAFD